MQGLTAGALAFCCAVALVLIDLATNRRSASELISEVARAEFGAPDQTKRDGSASIGAVDGNHTDRPG
jgi:hypothetical protein